MKALSLFLFVTLLTVFIFVPRATAGGGVTPAPTEPIEIPEPKTPCGCP